MRFFRSILASLSIVGLIALTACGSGDADSSADSTADSAAGASAGSGATATTGAPTASNSAKPAVGIPDELPTDLVITDLTKGTGPAARDGDTVRVRYVGVRSEDGVEFDNNYDGDPFPVTIGQGGVIAGWDQGLVGVQQGGRRQLDIPAELAYGDSPRGDVIRAGDALSFVIDVLTVIALPSPADKPAMTFEPQANVDELVVEDLVVGDGPEVELGQTAVMHLIAFRVDTGEEIASTWETGSVQPIPYVDGQALPGLFAGLDGLRVGGRRQITIPFADAFGAAGNEEFGLPGSTDMILVVDLIAAY